MTENLDPLRQKPDFEIGKWYLDGFCTDQIITPVKDERYQRGIRWEVVKRCVSREIAEISIKHHNK